MSAAMSIAFLSMILVSAASLVSAEQRARCNTLYPPYAFTAEEAQFVSDPNAEGAWEGRMLASKHANGDNSLEMLRLTIHPGQGWPPHRHFSADEWMYVISGSGGYAYWAFEEPQATEITIGPGHALYNPGGQLHSIWNTGTEPLVVLSVSKSLAPYEVLAEWPDTPGGGEGYVPHVAPWERTCAPGHELEEGEEGEEAEEAEGAAGYSGEGDEWSTGGEGGGAGLEGESEYGDEEDDDYASGDCGCSVMSETEIAECMAEPELYDDNEDTYDAGSYEGEGGEFEPEFGEFETEAHDEL